VYVIVDVLCLTASCLLSAVEVL